MRTAGLIAIATALCISAAASGAPLKGWTGHAEGYPVVAGMQAFADQVSKETAGKFSFAIYPSETLGPQDRAVDQARIGAIAWAVFNLGPLSDTVREYKVLTLPYVFKSEDHMFRVLDSPLGDEFNAIIEKYDLVGLGWYGSGSRSFYTTRQPIRTPDDLVGLRIRVPPSEILTDMVETLGARTVMLNFSEVQAALQAGIIDGAENNWPSFEATGHYKVARYYSLDLHAIVPEALVVSAKLWRTLDDRERAVFRTAGKASSLVMRRSWDERMKASKKTVSAAGVQVNEADVAAFAALMEPLYKKHLTPDLLPYLKKVQAVE